MKERKDDGNSQVDIVAVLLHYGASPTISQLSTGEHSVRCPFHDDSTASGSVHTGLGLYNCHACGIGGDGLKIIMKQEGIGFGEAVEFARSVLGQSVQNIPDTTKKGSKGKSRKPRRFISV